MLMDSNKNIGRVGISMAIAYFGANGWTVSIPLNDTQWYDLIVEKDNVFYTVQCKATASENNCVKLLSAGGTCGGIYDSILNHPIDYFFCVDKEGNMFNIPVEDLRKQGNRNNVTLRTQPTTNGQGFQTYKYQVYI